MPLFHLFQPPFLLQPPSSSILPSPVPLHNWSSFQPRCTTLFRCTLLLNLFPSISSLKSLPLSNAPPFRMQLNPLLRINYTPPNSMHPSPHERRNRKKESSEQMSRRCRSRSFVRPLDLLHDAHEPAVVPELLDGTVLLHAHTFLHKKLMSKWNWWQSEIRPMISKWNRNPCHMEIHYEIHPEMEFKNLASFEWFNDFESISFNTEGFSLPVFANSALSMPAAPPSASRAAKLGKLFGFHINAI